MWVGRYREDALGEDGARIRRHRTVVLGFVREIGMREAQRRLSDRLGAINQGRHKPELVITFERFVLERWEPNILPTLRYSTARNYRHVVRKHLLPFLGEIALPDVGVADVQMLIADKSKRYAPWTIHQVRSVLSKVFSTAQKWGYLTTNPALKVQIPSLTGTRERTALSGPQVHALLAQLSEPVRTMVLLAVMSGLRRGEIFGLRWKFVNFADRSITVAESSYEGHSSAPKTRASRRMVFVDGAVLDALARIKPENEQRDGLVFCTARGTALNPNNIRNRILVSACERAGIPQIGWHNFRYTYSTWADASGESIKALQAQLGHTDSRLTLSVYTQPMPEAQRRIAQKIALVLFPIVPKSEWRKRSAGVQSRNGQRVRWRARRDSNPRPSA